MRNVFPKANLKKKKLQNVTYYISYWKFFERFGKYPARKTTWYWRDERIYESLKILNWEVHEN